MIGRECPNRECGQYFKIRLGTGTLTETLFCPYCGTERDLSLFLTSDQAEYARRYAARRILAPMMRSFTRSVGRLNRGQRGGLIRLSVNYKPIRLHRYSERKLETDVHCDNCGLEFAVYGVFASCPCCQKLNALTTCLKSLETARRLISLVSDEGLDSDIREQFPRAALSQSVSAFDAYGKALRARNADIVGAKAKPNLFQDLDALDMELRRATLPGLAVILGTNLDHLRWFFQARHLYEHNAGVVDERFVSKLPAYSALCGRLLPLNVEDLGAGIDTLEGLARELDELFMMPSEA
ncbi:MAG: hypothetical protein OXQ29_18145 [Rhodospirillaceae bacterium]|nr:hypothetical protein [Rhodospirillaceae bacterium]